MITPVHVVPNALSSEELKDIKEYFLENRKYEIDEENGRPGYSYDSLFYIGLYKNGEGSLELIEDRIKPLLRVLETCEEYFLDTYKMNWDFAYKRGFLNCMEDGASLGSHSDDEDIYNGKRAQEIHYSGILLISNPEEYEGGVMHFWDQETNTDIAKFKPNAGDLVLFKGSTMHGVEAVTSGQRINHIIFYRDYNPKSEIIINEQNQGELRILAKQSRDVAATRGARTDGRP